MSAERVARNDAIFRQANEGIAAAGSRLDVAVVPFICECADADCTTLIPLRLDEYEAIRSDSTHFLNAYGHDASAGPHARVVEEHDGYVVVEKVGRAGEIVKDLDRRDLGAQEVDAKAGSDVGA